MRRRQGQWSRRSKTISTRPRRLPSCSRSAAPPAPTIRAVASSKAQLLAGGSLLGLLQQDPETWPRRPAGPPSTAEVERLIALRAAARRWDFAEADRIRDQLAAEGVILEDQSGKTRWRLAG